MPYIKKTHREEIVTGQREVSTVGELNFVITTIIRAYMGDDPDYARFNTLVGVLESAKLELYRRMVAPYEDAKRLENGDVYE